MWVKKFENTNVPIENMQELHSKMKEVYGDNFLEVFDYIPPESPTSDPDPYVELRFEEEPQETASMEELVDEYKVE